MKPTYLLWLSLITAGLTSGCSPKPAVTGDIQEVEIADKPWGSEGNSWITFKEGRIEFYSNYAVVTTPETKRVVALDRLGKVELKQPQS